MFGAMALYVEHMAPLALASSAASWSLRNRSRSLQRITVPAVTFR